jgi:hypothetical protein
MLLRVSHPEGSPPAAGIAVLNFTRSSECVLALFGVGSASPITRLLCLRANRKGSRKPPEDGRFPRLTDRNEFFELCLLERQAQALRKAYLHWLFDGKRDVQRT